MVLIVTSTMALMMTYDGTDDYLDGIDDSFNNYLDNDYDDYLTDYFELDSLARFITWHNRYKHCKSYKKIYKDLIATAWHPKICWNWCMSEEKKVKKVE